MRNPLGHERERPAGAAPAGGETVLVVDDERMLRALASRILAREGYRVLEAASAAAALELWRACRDHIALVVTDLEMPGGVDGWEMGERMRAERPDLAILYVSGACGDLPETARVLEKPYQPAALVSAVRAFIDERRGDAEAMAGGEASAPAGY